MWKIRRYGKSYIYDRLHRGFVLSMLVLGVGSFAYLGLLIVNIPKVIRAAANSEQESSKSRTIEDIKKTGELLTS